MPASTFFAVEIAMRIAASLLSPALWGVRITLSSASSGKRRTAALLAFYFTNTVSYSTSTVSNSASVARSWDGSDRLCSRAIRRSSRGVRKIR